jgi:type I restriction enzyme S subunit
LAENDARGEWALPDGWAWTTLGEIADLVGGGTPSRKVPEYFNGGIVWLTPTQIPKDRITVISDSQERITEEGLRKSSARLLPPGTVLMTSRASIGYVAVAGTEVTTNQGFASFVCKEGVYNFYLAYWLRGNADVFVQCATGTTFKEISKSKLRPFEFPLPPFPEQRRIVVEIETQFTRLDAAVAALERAQANIRRYKAAVLKAACEGQLVPTEAELARAEGRNYEPADQLLARILAERRARWEAKRPGKKYKEPAPPDTEDLPQLPEGWAYSLIEPLLSTSRSGMKTGPFGSLLKKHEHQPEGIPVLGIENIGPTGYVPGNKIFITEEKADQLSKYDVQPNDILISRSGTVGEVCIVPEGLGNARFSTNLMRIVLTPGSMLPKFFRFLFNGSPFVLDQVSELCSGSTRDFLNQKILKSIVFPLPPLAEQRRIVAEVERRLSLVGALEASVGAALARAGRLRQAVLKQAFEGRLVPQDPDDEPASVLLERIRAEREARTIAKGKQKVEQMRLPTV